MEQQASEGSTGFISETLSNRGTQPVEVIYLITLTSRAGCSSTETVRVTVNPKAGVSITLSEPDSIKYCICENGFSGVLIVEAETVEGAKLEYQWYSNTVASVEGGEAITGATESRYSTTPDGLPVGTHYYYCKVTSDYNATPVYSDIYVVTVEPDE
ncbi:MAG: hypothetical protein LBQ01_05375, partial [Prevotellaceae bacterium]|nr:hypothetical protein [Prevotellaceae bacterium]